VALVFGDSFDHYAIGDILKKWSSATNMTTSVMTNTQQLAPHGQCLWALGNASGYYEKPLASPLTTFIAGTWFKTGSIANASLILAFMDSATPANIHVSVRYDTSGHITLCNNATVLATSTNTLSIGTWYHIEVKATIGDAADSPSGRYEVRVNGTATNWIPDSGTGKDTRNSGNATIGSYRIYSRGTNDGTLGHFFQDFYILDTTGSVSNDFVGPSVFSVSRTVRDGYSSDWTSNYAQNVVNVGEFTGDGDTTFNQSSTAAQIDLFEMTGVPTGTIHAIQHVIMARQDAGAQRTIRPKVRIGSTTYNGTTVNAPASYLFITEAVSVSPATSSAWDDDEINGAEFGYELVS